MPPFSHLNDQQQPQMVDVAAKISTHRLAVAQAVVRLNPSILQHFKQGDIQTAKGAVFQTAMIAGTMAAKKTGDLIPLCHPIGLESCSFTFVVEGEKVVIDCSVSVFAKTGVEMEALTGASIAALTIYDMCKAFSHDIVIEEIKLMAKIGGKSDFKR